VPELSRFLGIVVSMYHREHGPPHFHAYYGEYEVSVQIWNGVVHGRFPPRELRHLLEWYDLHRAEPLQNWELAANERPLERIDPLE
jgi:hypothetical protein